MRDFGGRGLEGSGTAILAVTGTGKMPVQRRAAKGALAGAGAFRVNTCGNEVLGGPPVRAASRATGAGVR
ncbi:MAG: hypothetical protein ABSF45_30615, partial [Terriglobia bacterium]